MGAEATTIEIPSAGAFARALKIARTFTSDDYGRPILCAVMFRPGVLEATDSYVLIRFPWHVADHRPFLVDRSDVKRMMRLIDDVDAACPATLEVGEKRATFTVSQHSISFPLVDSSAYPANFDDHFAKADLAEGEAPCHALHFNPSFLAKFAVLGSSGAWPVTLSMPKDALRPMRFDHSETGASGLIMPVRV